MTKVKLSNILLFVIACILCIIAVVPRTAAFADTEYTVLDDFAGTSLDISKYPAKSDNWSLEVIQLAETDNGGVVVYVYQPSGGDRNILATSINVSTYGDDWFNYKLEYLGNYNTIYKYKVKDLTVSSDIERSYSVSSIYRAFNADIDDPSGNDNTVNEIAYSVGLQWTAQTVDGKIEYSVKAVELIKITDEWVGLTRYSSFNEGDIALSWTDNHFVAFSTDRDIDKLMEADVYFHAEKHREVRALVINQIITKDEVVDSYSDVTHLRYTDIDGNNADGSIAKKYKWNCIQTATQFLETEELTDSAIEYMQGKQWVLRFLSVDYKLISIPSAGAITYRTVVTDVTVLSLKFETNGQVYNLGVVNDKVTGSHKPANTNTDDNVIKSRSWFDRAMDSIASFFKGIGEAISDFFSFLFGDFSDSWWTWLIIIVVIFVVLLFIPVIGPVLISGLKVIGKGLLWLFKGLWWLICLPFKGIAALVRKIKERRGTA